MTLPVSGVLTMTSFATEFGGTQPPTIKYTGGHGIRGGQNRVLNSTELNAASGSSLFKFIDSSVCWGFMETTQGSYDFNLFDSNLAACAAIGKKLIFEAEWKRFGTTNRANVIPADMTDNPTYGNGTVVVGTTVMATMWLDATRDRYLTFMDEFIRRYDSEPNLEMVLGSESSSSLVSPFPPGFDRTTYANKLKDIIDHCAAGFVQTMYGSLINFTSGEVGRIIEDAYVAKAAMGNPDAYDIVATNIFKGLTVAGDTTIRDYRGLMPNYAIASTAVLGGGHDNGPPANIILWAQDHGVTHLSWVPGLATPNTLAEIKVAIAANPTLLVVVPGNLP